MGTLTPPLYTVVMLAKVKFHFVVLFQSPIVGAGHDLPFGHWNKFRFSEDDLHNDRLRRCDFTLQIHREGQDPPLHRVSP